VHLDVLAGFVAFGVVASASPGPNNLMLMTSGAKFGFARTAPHLAGVILGFSLMVALVGLGLDADFHASRNCCRSCASWGRSTCFGWR
jgi:threonine/homoserine/homoserine lactone efflux protein